MVLTIAQTLVAICINYFGRTRAWVSFLALSFLVSCCCALQNELSPKIRTLLPSIAKSNSINYLLKLRCQENEFLGAEL